MIYFLRRADGAIKIGTTENYHVRHLALTTEHGDLELLGWMEGSYEEEHQLHRQFATNHADFIRSEWFFETPELLAYIQQNTQLEIPPHVAKPAVFQAEERLVRAIYMLVGEKRFETGRRVSVNEAVWNLIETYRPEIAARTKSTMHLS